MATQPSGAGFIAVDKILSDLTDRRGLRQAWDDIDRDIQAEIKHTWALLITEVLDMQATVIKHQQEKICVCGSKDSQFCTFSTAPKDCHLRTKVPYGE